VGCNPDVLLIVLAETSEGLDVKISLHYYSRMAFIQALLPKLQASDDARVLR